MEPHPTPAAPTCATCEAPLQGKFCHECGEKALNPEQDFSVRHFLEEIIESFAHLDSKLLRSFWALLSRPGLLTAEFLAGRRVRYFKPIPLFAIASVLFYFFFASATAFFSNFDNMNDAYTNKNRMANTFHVDTKSLFDQKVAALQAEPEQLKKNMTIDAGQRSKTWLFLMVPFWGFLLWLSFRRKLPWLASNMIFALHGLTFFILIDMVFLLILRYIFQLKQLGDGYTLWLALCFGTYCTIAARRVYGFGKLGAFLAGVLTLFWFLVVLMLYRQAITVWTMYFY